MPTEVVANQATLDSSEVHRNDQTFEFSIWVFLLSETMLFAALLSGAVAYRVLYPDAFAEGSRHLNVVYGTVNTFILLTSSLLVAMAVATCRDDRSGVTRKFLLGAVALGSLFLLVKANEYRLEYAEGLVPAAGFSYSGPNAPQVKLFFILYFLITLLHALHLIIGLVFLGLTAHFSKSRVWLDTQNKIVSSVGLYWHFVDVVWVFVFPILYLNGRSA